MLFVTSTSEASLQSNGQACVFHDGSAVSALDNDRRPVNERSALHDRESVSGNDASLDEDGGALNNGAVDYTAEACSMPGLHGQTGETDEWMVAEMTIDKVAESGASLQQQRLSLEEVGVTERSAEAAVSCSLQEDRSPVTYSCHRAVAGFEQMGHCMRAEMTVETSLQEQRSSEQATSMGSGSSLEEDWWTRNNGRVAMATAKMADRSIADSAGSSRSNQADNHKSEHDSEDEFTAV